MIRLDITNITSLTYSTAEVSSFILRRGRKHSNQLCFEHGLLTPVYRFLCGLI